MEKEEIVYKKTSYGTERTRVRKLQFSFLN